MTNDLLAKDRLTRASRALRAAWYRLPDCPGEIYAPEARALAKAVLEAIEPDAPVILEAGESPNNFPTGKLAPAHEGIPDKTSHKGEDDGSR